MAGSIRSRAKCSAKRVWYALVVAFILLGAGERFAVAEERLLAYEIVGDAIPASLTGSKSDAARRRSSVIHRTAGLCVLCSSGALPEEQISRDLRLTRK